MSNYALNVINTYTGAARTAYVGTRHLREVLYRLEIAHYKYYSGSRQNDIEMLHYINNTFTREQIATVHYKVADELPKKGRPRWATNKSSNNAVPSNMSTELADMRKSLEAAQAAMKAAAQQQANGAAHPSNDIEPGDYVTSEEFAEHVRSNATDNAAHIQNNIALRRELLDKIDAIEAAKPVIVHIKPVDEAKPLIDLGLQHCSMPDLLTAAQTGLNIWLYGPAGTGKSVACEMLAKAYNRDFRGNGKIIDDIKLTGFRDGYGKFHTTQFLEAYRDGHIYCGDELDSWSNEAAVALQGALANGWIEAGGEIIKQHPNFLFIGAANTTGKGATVEYVGRNQLDAAFLDRFIQIAWPHDNALEDAIVSNKEWLAYVRTVRANLSRHNDIKNHLVTMRAALNGQKLLATGMPWDKVVDMCLRKGLAAHIWDKIK